jgi:hypothetical protein
MIDQIFYFFFFFFQYEKFNSAIHKRNEYILHHLSNKHSYNNVENEFTIFIDLFLRAKNTKLSTEKLIELLIGVV